MISHAMPANTVTPIPPSLLNYRRLCDDYPLQRPFLIDGVLREQEVMAVVAPTKAAKSWLVLDMAMSVACGTDFLKTFPVQQKKVLYIDAELKPDTFADRMRAIQRTRQYAGADLVKNLDVELLRRRGQTFDIRELSTGYFRQFKSKGIGLVVLDCLYKFLPPQWSENDHENMAQVVKHLDRIAGFLNCCVCIVHHTTKGDQGSKRQVDIGSGAGSFQRAVDTLLTLRDHESEGFAVLESASRSCRSIDPLTTYFTWPCWHVDPTQKAAVKSPRSAAKEAKSKEDQMAMQHILDLKEFTVKDIRNKLGCGEIRANRLRLKLEESGDIEEIGLKKLKHARSETMFYRVTKPTGTETGTETGTVVN